MAEPFGSEAMTEPYERGRCTERNAYQGRYVVVPSQTRWLSLLSVIERILEQREALRLFFIDFTTNPAHRARADVRNRAVFILEKLSNPFYKLYFFFLEWSLPLFNKFNLEFQSEKVVVHNLHEKIRTLYQEIVLHHLQREYVMRQNLGEINPESQQHQLHDAALYLGVKVYELLKHPDVIRKPADLHSSSHAAKISTKLPPPKSKSI
ncbi:hypothetical protein ACJJTC_019035 [Scirpophaga incertulas]